MSPPNIHYDVIVIGASLGGSVAALQTGRTGKSVLMLDPQSFPRRKACGEGLSVLGYSYLQALGLWNEKLNEESHPFYGYKIELRSRKCLSLESPLSQLQGFGVSRVLLDSSVYEQAASLPTVEVSSQKVEVATRLESSWVISTEKGETYRSKSLIFACGSSARKLLPALTVQASNVKRYAATFWFRGEWQEAAPASVLIRHTTQGQYLITPLGNVEVNVSVLLAKDLDVRTTRNNLVSEVQRFLTESGFSIHETLANRGVAEIQGLRVKASLPGVYLVGDAAERLDPIGGMGMTHAIFSAVLASKALCFEFRNDSARQLWYERRRKRGAMVLRLLTRMSYQLNVTSNPVLCWFVGTFPSVALGCISLLRGVFPSPKETLREFPAISEKGWFRIDRKRVSLPVWISCKGQES